MDKRLNKLHHSMQSLYLKKSEKLLFHGWHHVNFVFNKSLEKPLFIKNIYFYTKLAKRKYLKWARINLLLWDNIKESLNDKSVQQVLSDAKNLKVI